MDELGQLLFKAHAVDEADGQPNLLKAGYAVVTNELSRRPAACSDSHTNLYTDKSIAKTIHAACILRKARCCYWFTGHFPSMRWSGHVWLIGRVNSKMMEFDATSPNGVPLPRHLARRIVDGFIDDTKFDPHMDLPKPFFQG